MAWWLASDAPNDGTMLDRTDATDDDARRHSAEPKTPAGAAAGPQPIEQFIRGLLDAWNARDVDRIIRLYALDYTGVDVSQRGPQLGRAGIREMVIRYLEAFPDLRFTIDEIVVQGNRAVIVWRAEGTHTGPVMSIPPTGHSVAVDGVSLVTVEHGHIASARYIWDVAGLLRAIKLLPDL